MKLRIASRRTSSLDADRTADAEAATGAEGLTAGCEGRRATRTRVRKRHRSSERRHSLTRTPLPSLTKPVRRRPAELSHGRREAPEVVALNADVPGRGETPALRRAVPRKGGRVVAGGRGRDVSVVGRELSHRIAAFPDPRNVNKREARTLSKGEGDSRSPSRPPVRLPASADTGGTPGTPPHSWPHRTTCDGLASILPRPARPTGQNARLLRPLSLD